MILRIQTFLYVRLTGCLRNREYFMESAGVRYLRSAVDVSEIERVSAANE